MESTVSKKRSFHETRQAWREKTDILRLELGNIEISPYDAAVA
jgi:hypothetical protein